MRTTSTFLSLMVGCGGVHGSSPDARVAPPADAPLTVDAPNPCDPAAKFGAPMPVPGLGAIDAIPARLSPDELTLYSCSVTQDPSDLWVAHRSTLTGAFGPPTFLTAENSASFDGNPAVSSDGLMLWFNSNRVANQGQGSFDIWTSHRSTVNDGFPAPTLVDELNTPGAEVPTWLSPDNCRLYGGLQNPGGGFRLFVATRQP